MGSERARDTADTRLRAHAVATPRYLISVCTHRSSLRLTGGSVDIASGIFVIKLFDYHKFEGISWVALEETVTRSYAVARKVATHAFVQEVVTVMGQC